MPDLHARLSARGRWRLGAVTAIALAITLSVWTTERRRANLHKEVRWLRTRLAEKREQIERQRQEMAEVVGAVERLAHTTAAVRERATQARLLAHMEESRDAPADPVAVKVTLDGSASLVSEEAARALEHLVWLDGQTAAVGDSIAVLCALLKERSSDGKTNSQAIDVPTLWPVRGTVTSRFGTREDPYGGGLEYHPGIDIRARYGLPVTSGGDGKVIFAGKDPGYGGLVVVQHGGEIDTFYGHLSAIYVRAGQLVRRGQPLGAVGDSGRATGAHLHYEVRVRGAPVDPHRYLVN